MKRRSLIYKLMFTSTSILFTILVVLSLILSVWFSVSFYNYKKSEIYSKSTVVAAEAVTYLNLKQSLNYNALKYMVDTISVDTGADILVTDNIGIIHSVSSEEHESRSFSSLGISEESMDVLRLGERVEYKKENSDGIEEYIYLNPVFDGNYFCGIVAMIMPTSIINNTLFKVYGAICIFIILEIALFSITLYILGKRIVEKPLNEINSIANKLSKGEFDKRIVINTSDEIAELAKSFNVMAESLETVDRNRRDFISNVSHELRSPITSINGFISGIIDGVIPKDKENYYLNIINDEIKRLSRLVNDLLDISAMESGKFKLSMMEFDLNALIKICLTNLQVKFGEKELQIQVIFENNHQFIYGDRDRLIQVMTNLLDNSIKYSNNGGKIIIEVSTKGEKIYTSISNEGPSLSDEEMIRIWDRFYKADKARTNKESTGLGLPIVRLILTQHNEEIWVENNKEKGVKFTFTLEKM